MVAHSVNLTMPAAHRDYDPRRNGKCNLRGLCQRCHLAHDRLHHRRQRWLTWGRRSAIGDLFLGLYADLCRRTEAALSP
ncbi:MAG TPA: hypothetical protein VE690_08895 [Rhodopila sp.]|nr:hypothetical protein [Rhodopila sp.]